MDSVRTSGSDDFSQTRLIKLGGSLMDLPCLPDLLLSALDTWSPMRTIIVVGGGKAADLVRTWDAHWQLGQRRSHQLAIFAMTWNARKLFAKRSEFQLIRHVNAIECSEKTNVILTEPFLNSIVPKEANTQLPESWDLTSDSIAAYLAVLLKADQLVLLKSAELEQSTWNARSELVQKESGRFSLQDISSKSELESLANDKLVDAYFPTYASAIPQIHWCNLRRPEAPSLPMSGH